MKKNKSFAGIRNIILLIILLILLGLIIYNKSFAVEYANLTNLMTWGKVGDNLKISWGYREGYNEQLNVESSEWADRLYCVQHGNHNVTSTYGIVYKISIEGNHAISSHMVDGKYLTSDSNANGTLAYILGGGNYKYGYGKTSASTTDRQRELWHYWTTWLNESGTKLGITGWYDEVNDTIPAVSTLEAEAINYSQTNNIAQVTSNVGTSIDTDNQKAGPFNITYSGNISSIEIKDKDGNIVNNDIYYKRNIEDKETIQIGDIVSGQDFYIENWSGKILKDITINVSSSNEVIKADIWLLSSGSGSQRLIAASPKKTTETKTASVTIGLETNNTFRVVKYGVNNNKEIKQTKVGFVVYRDGTGYLKRNNIEGYIGKEVQIGKMEYNETQFSWTNDKNEATIFETVNTDDGWTGYFQITQIPSGTYYIGEVYNRNQGYEQSTISRCNLEKYKGDNKIDSTSIVNVQNNENVSGYDNKLQVVKVPLENDGYTKVLRVYDTVNPEFNIYIKKVNTSNTKIGGAEFKIKVLDKDGDALGWLEKVSNTKYNYNADYKDASIWSSTKSSTKKDSYIYATTKGEIEITNLSTEYQYQIYETKQGDSCYALSSQIISSSSGMNVKINDKKVNDIKYIKASNKSTESNDYAATDESIYCGTTSYEAHRSTADVKVTNRPKRISGGRRRRKLNKILICWRKNMDR